VAPATPARSDCAARLLAATRLYLTSPPEASKNWLHNNPNLNDYHPYPMEISSTSWICTINYWWRQQEESHWKYADLSNLVHDIVSIIWRGLEVEASFSLGHRVVGWSQSITKGKTLRENVILRQFVQADNGILADPDPALHTENTKNNSVIVTGLSTVRNYTLQVSTGYTAVDPIPQFRHSSITILLIDSPSSSKLRSRPFSANVLASFSLSSLRAFSCCVFDWGRVLTCLTLVLCKGSVI